jgi:hypothetical protein
MGRVVVGGVFLLLAHQKKALEKSRPKKIRKIRRSAKV